MDSSLQIDNIQSFIKVTDNNITPWRLLVKNVRDALRSCGISEREEIIKLVKRYNFDSPGILFTPDNYDSWRKLANNDGTINDARYLVHEIAEVKELERIKQQKEFDYMGKGMESMTRKQKREWAIDFKI